MRKPTNIQSATFAGLRVDVGNVGGHLYARGLITKERKDGWWTLLTQLPDGKYQATLPGNRKLTSVLEFVQVVAGRPP